MPTVKSNRSTVFFLVSQIISLFGSSLVQCSISWQITLETQSGTMMTIALICGFLPMFLVAPFAGVWADRYNRKRLIIFSDAMIAIATLGLGAAFWLGYRDIKLIFAIMVIRGLGQGIQSPAVGSVLPSLAAPEQLMRLNSINSAAQSAMMLVSPALAAALISVAPLEYIFLIDIATAVVAIVILTAFVKLKPREKDAVAEKVSYFGDIKLGLKYLAGNKIVKLISIFSIVINLLSAPIAVLYALQVTRLFGADAWRLGVADTAFAVGMLAGGLLLTAWGGLKNKHSTASIGIIVVSVGTLFLGVVVSFPLFIAMMVLIGFAMPVTNTPSITMLQENTDPEYMGRMFSLLNMVSSLAMPLGLVVFGPLADVIGLGLLFVLTGGAMIVLSLAFALNKTIHAAGVMVKKEKNIV